MRAPDATARLAGARPLLLGCFFVSGFTALAYQTVWMRLALAAYGVGATTVATVLSSFMIGLALGSYGAGRLMRRAEARSGLAGLRVYGAAEAAVGAGGVLVPPLLTAGRGSLLALGASDGAAYTAASAVILALVLLPFCTAMGVTFPAAVAFLRRGTRAGAAALPFGGLYLANVAGAFAGATVTPLLLVEWLGFRITSLVAVAASAAVAAAALLAYRRAAAPPPPLETRAAPSRPYRRGNGPALFVTGFVSMGMEVVWTRIYPTVLGTFVYSFAAILALYLVATTAGAAAYRLGLERGWRLGPRTLWPWLLPAAILPLLAASPRLAWLPGLPRVAAGLVPFCALLGALTPALVDEEAGDDPERVGGAYGINLLGCLLGPLAAGFLLLPLAGARTTALALALPLAVPRPGFAALGRRAIGTRLAAAGVAAVVWWSSPLFEDGFPESHVRHDRIATVVADGTGMDKRLYVNGVGMTVLTTITKMMAHLPAAELAETRDGPVEALVICFGMGTSFRSLASWGADTTAVELVPSVTDLFGYYFPDGPAMIASSSGRLRVVHDDGRRYLDRTTRRFDLITIDPPPPVEAAASSLLYSEEFYASARRVMRPGAILQLWLPGGDRATIGGVAKSILVSFPYVRVFGSIEGYGYHFLASDRPIPRLGPDRLVERMPPAAVADMTEWIKAPPARFFERMLAKEYDPASLLVKGGMEATVAITDDRPVNEFFFLRRAFGPGGSLGRTIRFIRP